MTAAISPTCCLELPLMITRVGWGTSNSIPCGALLGTVGRAGDEQLLALLADLDRAVLALLEIAAGTGHADDLGLDRHVDAGGDGDGLLSDSGHVSEGGGGYQIWATSSPPTPSRRASWPV